MVFDQIDRNTNTLMRGAWLPALVASSRSFQSPDAIRPFLFRAAITSDGNCGLITDFIAGSDADSDSSDCAEGDGILPLSPVTIATIHAPIAKVIHASTSLS